jgi:hypothetical protein
MITGLRPDDSASVSATPKEPDDLLRRSEFLLGATTGLTHRNKRHHIR